jgi:hypothetical protein
MNPLAEPEIGRLETYPTGQRNLKLVERARAEIAARQAIPTIGEVRSLPASIPGSLSRDVIAERGDY